MEDLESQKEAARWLSNEIKNIPNMKTRRDQLNSPLTEKSEGPPICELVLFKYEAIVGNASGYWDKYPIVLIVRPLEENFFGFNLHYLDAESRQKIIDVIHKITQKKISREKMQMMIYPFLSALVKIKTYNHAYKNYAYKNVDSKMIVISHDHYHLVSNLPIARFKGNKK